ncbi:alpha-E domain-containing protein [Gynuella sp.]|uniref:alpha-E domain-containing protein n=1 Tax=Gynuella sp. TaxID=2969146 RepID=UPI003D0CA4FB
MLSRVAARVYWTARYLERVENTARLLSVFNSLLLDLPSGINLGWYNLVIINGSEEGFERRYKVRNERNVLRFMIADANNASSIVNMIHWVKENLRTSRDVLPSETWELINELNMFVRENITAGINKGSRHEFLDHIVRACQQIVGLMVGVMSRDAGWHFLHLGRNIERADMTTRFLDAGAAMIMNEVDSPNRDQIVWNNVLSSASAIQAYLRETGSEVSGPEVVEFLVENSQFPRSLKYCLHRVKSCIDELPRNKQLSAMAGGVLDVSLKTIDYNKLGQELRDYLNDLQVCICELHDGISENWFAV